MPYVRRTALGRRPIFGVPEYLKTRRAIGSGVAMLLIGGALAVRGGPRAPVVGEGAYQLGTVVASATACETESATYVASSMIEDAPTLAAYVRDSANRCRTLDRGTPIELDEVKGLLDGIHVRGNAAALWVPGSSVR